MGTTERRRAAGRDEQDAAAEFGQQISRVSSTVVLLICLSGGDGIRVLGRGPLIRVFLNALVVRVDPSGDGR
jgi:hypothetical protein